MAFRSYANTERFNPTTVPNETNKVLQQGQDALRALQRAQNFNIENRNRYQSALSDARQIEERNRTRVFQLDQDNRQRVQDQIQQNYLRSIRDAEVQGKQEIDTLKALSTFSTTAFQAVEAFNEKREEAIKVGVTNATMESGASLKELVEISKLGKNMTEQQLRENSVIQNLLDRGASIDSVKYLVRNSNAKYFNENRALIENTAAQYPSYASSNYNTKYKVGDSEISLAEAEQTGNYDAIPILQKQQRLAFFAESGLKDVPGSILAAYAFPTLRAYEAQVTQRVNALQRKQISDDLVVERNQTYANIIRDEGARGIASLLSGLPSGSERSAAKANILSFFTNASAGDEASEYQQVFQDLLTQTTTLADGTETTLGEFWKNDPNVIAVSRAFVDARRRKLQDFNLQEAENLNRREVAENVFIEALTSQEGGFTKEDVQAAEAKLDEIVPGYDSSRLSFMLKNETVNAKYEQKVTAQLEDLADRGLLTNERLESMGVPGSIAARFRAIANATSKDRSSNDNFKPQMEAIESLVKSPPQIQAKPDGQYNFSVPLMVQQLENKFLTKYAKYKALNDPDAANSAFNEVRQEFQAQISNPGFFDNTPDNLGGYKQFTKAAKPSGAATARMQWIQSSIARLGSGALDSNGSIFTISELNSIEKDMQKPGFRMDPMAEYIGRQFGVDPFTVINRQRVAAGLEMIQLPEAAVSFRTTVNPKLQRLLDSYGTPEISTRAMASTGQFNPGLVPNGYGPLVVEAANSAGISPAAVAALAEAENGAWDPNIFSGGGYSWDGRSTGVGLMQLSQEYFGTGSTVQEREQALKDPNLNLRLGAGTLAQLYNKYGSWKDSIFAWNMGETGYQRWKDSGSPQSDRQSQYATKLYERFQKARAKYGDVTALRSSATMRQTMRQYGSASFEKPSSVVYETSSGQPGVDLYFESKRFPAVLGGVVKDVSREPGYGNYVVVESLDPNTGQKVDVLYSHLADGVTMKPGQQLEAGDIIGTQGGTGRVRSVDGTIASIDFLAPAPRGSKSMKPYAAFDSLRRYVVSQLQR